MNDTDSETGNAPMPEVTVLVVDDDPGILSAVTRTLHQLPCRIRTASSAEEALPLLSAPGNIAVTIADQYMPGMLGIDFLKQVARRCPQSARILLTGQPDLQQALAAMEQGTVTRLVKKPWEPEKLSSTVSILLRQWHGTKITIGRAHG